MSRNALLLTIEQEYRQQQRKKLITLKTERNMKKLVSTILAAMATMPILAASDKPVDGLSYCLPKTAVRMHVLVEKTVTTPGQLADFSELYFKTPATSNKTTDYRIVGVTFSTCGVPDDSKRFAVAIDKKHSVLSVDCDVNGVLRAINTQAPASSKPAQFHQAAKPAPLNPRDYMSQDILAASNLPKMAQLVAQEIYDVRDSRNLLSRGEAEFMPKDGEQLRLMYAQLNRQEKALMQLFQGTTTVDTTETVVTFVPEKDVKRAVAFRFSKKFGLTTSDDLSGEPYYVNVSDENVLADAPATNEAVKKEKDDFQLGVSLPGKIRLTLTDGSKAIAYYETWAAQYGRVEMLNGALFGKKLTSKLIIDESTGAVVELQTEPIE